MQPWFALMVLTAAAVYYWQITLPVALAYGGYKLARWYHHTRQARLEALRRDADAKTARLIEHADREHSQIQQGDPDGIYGAYPPPDETRGLGIWLTDAERPHRSGAARDIGFAG